MRTFKRMLLIVAGVTALALGMVGLVMPLLPGAVLLGVAVLCFAGASRRLRARLHASPRIRPYLARWEAGAGLPAAERVRLAFWLALAAAGDLLRRPRMAARGR